MSVPSENDSFILRESRTAIRRILPRLRSKFAEHIETPDWQVFEQRLDRHFDRLFDLLSRIYGPRYDFFYHVESILTTAAQMWLDRPADLKGLDAVRENQPQWYQDNNIMGGMVYVDRFAGDLEGLRKKIPYLQEVGISYLHLMPLFKCPRGDNDGGYAISSYREVDERYGTIDDLRDLARELRKHGISMVLDFVFNHTSDEHEWARKAMAGEEEYQEYYRLYGSRKEPDAYERTIRSIFPDEHPGCFTYRSAMRKWVWTTFHNYQWDLNYHNPSVFNAMAGEMLYLANSGVEVLRMDAVPFLWKELGTSCENLPQAHWLIQAYNSLVRIAAPALIFKSEAIVAPDEINRYISPDECHISYNPLLMALLWNSAATREAKMLTHSMEKRFTLPEECSWVNYLRSHDDIGWGFSDEDTEEVGVKPFDHRQFLNRFFSGEHKASFARGLRFQDNPATGDARICGTMASLCGLERALDLGEEEEIELAIRRHLLLHGILFTIGGIPLIYLGDEIGMLNDYSYAENPDLMGDQRWVHRPVFDWEKAKKRSDPESVEGRIFAGMLKLVQIRRHNQAFHDAQTEIVNPGNPHVFAYFRNYRDQNVLCLANFSEQPQDVSAARLRQLGLRRTFTDIVSGQTVIASHQLTMEPLQFAVLVGGG